MIDVEVTIGPTPAEPPKFTAVTWSKPVPAMVTDVPLESLPTLGLTAVTVGAAYQVKRLLVGADVPARFVTVTFWEPEPAGETAVIDVTELTVKLAAASTRSRRP